jgi:hypothetical protein
MKRLTAESAFMVNSFARKPLTPGLRVIGFTIGAVPMSKLILRKFSAQNFFSLPGVLCQTGGMAGVLQ